MTTTINYQPNYFNETKVLTTLHHEKIDMSDLFMTVFKIETPDGQIYDYGYIEVTFKDDKQVKFETAHRPMVFRNADSNLQIDYLQAINYINNLMTEALNSEFSDFQFELKHINN